MVCNTTRRSSLVASRGSTICFFSRILSAVRNRQMRPHLEESNGCLYQLIKIKSTSERHIHHKTVTSERMKSNKIMCINKGGLLTRYLQTNHQMFSKWRDCGGLYRGDYMMDLQNLHIHKKHFKSSYIIKCYINSP